MAKVKVYALPWTPLLLVAASCADAQEWKLFGDSPWYGSARFGWIMEDSEASFVGRTESIYGGTPRVPLDDGIYYSIALGHKVFDGLFDGFSFEIELSQINSNTTTDTIFGNELRDADVFRLDADVDSTMLFAHLKYELEELDWWARPFVRAGIGVSRNSVSAALDVTYESPIWLGTSFEDSELSGYRYPDGDQTEFAWSFSAGFRMPVSDSFSLRLEYGALSRGDVWTDADDNDDYITFSELDSQQLLFGVDYEFR